MSDSCGAGDISPQIVVQSTTRAFLYLQVLRTHFPDAVMSNDIREVAALPKVKYALGQASQIAIVPA